MKTGDRGPELEGIAGVSEETAHAFAVLGNETRLSILVALWEAFEPFAEEHTLSFSELRQRVGIRQGAQFNYHLDKLVGEFIEKTESGYQLHRAGHRVVQSVIAGIGPDDAEAAATEIGITCPFCDAATAVRYEDEWLYLVCTECPGFFEGPDRPAGMLTGMEFDPAGLIDRDAEAQWWAGWVWAKTVMQLAVEGVCDVCSGEMTHRIDICSDHEAGGSCPRCGRQFRVMVEFVCPVCKNFHEVPPRTLVIHHPAVIAFYYDRGVCFQFADRSFERFRERGELIAGHEQTLVSEDPVRVEVTIGYAGDQLVVTLDDDLQVIDSECGSG